MAKRKVKPKPAHDGDYIPAVAVPPVFIHSPIATRSKSRKLIKEPLLEMKSSNCFMATESSPPKPRRRTNIDRTNIPICKKKEQFPTTNQHLRAKLKVVMRKRRLKLKKCPLPAPIDMPRTVELVNGPPVRSKESKILFLAGLGIYRTPGDKGWLQEKMTLQGECDKFTRSLSDSGSSENSPEDKNSSKVDDEKDEWQDFGATMEENSSEVEKSSKVEDETGEWQDFGTYMEVLLRQENALPQKVGIDEIEEAKLKICKFTADWAQWLKG